MREAVPKLWHWVLCEGMEVKMKVAEIAGPSYLTYFPSEVKYQCHGHLPRRKQTIEHQSWETLEALQREKMDSSKWTGLAVLSTRFYRETVSETHVCKKNKGPFALFSKDQALRRNKIFKDVNVLLFCL